MNKSKLILLLLIAIITYGFTTYPIDGYARTGISRLIPIAKMRADSIEYKRIPPGAYKSLNDIELNLVSRKSIPIDSLLKEDPDFDRELRRLFPGNGYSAAVLDMTNPEELKYMAYRENVGYQPGSVGKLAVLLALFDQLAKLCPEDFEQRLVILRERVVGSGIWGTGDHHTVPVYDPQKETVNRRTVVARDSFSLFEWADHMVSVSNNGAASVLYREALLMAGLGKKYLTLTEDEANRYFEETPRDSLTDLANEIVNEPLRKLGITEDEWRLGGFFTRGPGKYVGRKGGSIGTPVGLMKFLVQLEQGKVIDEASSLEMKRLMYLTDRRIRYAYSNRLDSAAVYFKSGSFYKCDREKDPDCGDYAGNVFNYMNSVIIVEHPDDTKYIVCLMTNVLNKNSAGAHMYLASAIDDIIR